MNKTDVRVYGLTLKCLTLPTIHYFTLDYPTAIVGGHPIHLHQLREVLRLPTHPLLLLTSSILRKSDVRIPITSIARLYYTISTHYIASWISSQAYFSKVDGYSHSISDGRLHRMCRRRCDWSEIMCPFYRFQNGIQTLQRWPLKTLMAKAHLVNRPLLLPHPEKLAPSSLSSLLTTSSMTLSIFIFLLYF